MSFDLAEALPMLQRTPSVLDSLLRGMPDRWIRADEGPDTFSPFDVVGHLIEGERHDWMGRARMILASRQDPFEPFDRFRHQSTTAGRNIDELLDEFAALRAANLEELRGWRLTEASLELTGVHPTFGAVSLRQLLATWVVHDLGHLAQAARVMEKIGMQCEGVHRQWVRKNGVFEDVSRYAILREDTNLPEAV